MFAKNNIGVFSSGYKGEAVVYMIGVGVFVLGSRAYMIGVGVFMLGLSVYTIGVGVFMLSLHAYMIGNSTCSNNRIEIY